jgi:hypothetical protein
MSETMTVRKFGCYVGSMESTTENLKAVLGDLEAYFAEHGDGELLYDIVSSFQEYVGHLEADLRSVQHELRQHQGAALLNA